MTEQIQKLLDRFDKWLDSKPRKQIISAQCANIAEEYAEEQLRLHGVINWVAIKDKKPEFGGFFLCCLENGHVTEIMYEFFNDVWHRNNQEVKQHNKLVYWAELPEPPCL